MTAPTRSSRPPTPDPRLAARRRDVKRSEGRRRLRTLIALAVITMLSVGALGALQSSLLDVDEIVVVGNTETDADAIRVASGIALASPLVEIDRTTARRNIAALPWVDRVAVDRSWRGTVTIRVTERTPAVALPSPIGTMLVDAEGRQLALVGEAPFGFVPIDGVVASGRAGDPAPSSVHGVIRLLELLSPERQQEIERVMVEDGALVLLLASGGRVDLGSDSGLPEKLVSLDTLLKAVDLRCLHEIDVRVHTAPTVTRRHASGAVGAPLTDLSTCT